MNTKNILAIYMKPDELWEYVSKGGKTSSAKPPSHIIQSTFQQYKGIPPREIIGQVAQEILLPLDEVDVWFEHVKQASENCARGAKKAAETRKKQKAHCDTGKERGANQEKQTGKQRKKSKRNEKSTSGPDRSEPNEEIVCKDCGMCEPPEEYMEDNADISWIQCDCCDSWFHVECLGSPLLDTWICYCCEEQ
jgi:hypothetical protein